MKSILTALAWLLLMTGASISDTPMPPMPENMVVIDQGQCVDHKSKESGYCVFFGAPDGTVWMALAQDGKVMLLRHVFSDGKPYEDVWMADSFGSF